MKRTAFHTIFYLTLFFICIAFAICANESSAQEAANRSDIELSVKTDNEIAGYSEKANIHFSANYIEDSLFETNIYIKNKHFNVKVGYGERAGKIHLQGEDIYTKEIVTISEDEAELIRLNLQSMLNEGIGTNRIEQDLLRTFNLLYSWPADLPVIIDPDDITIPDECGLEYPEGVSEDLCLEINGPHIGRFATEGEFCGWLKFNEVPILKLDAPTVWMEDVEHLVGGEECFGRCGRSCIGDGPPNSFLDIYTQDCFDHDLCAENEGLLDAECNWMFIDTIDDFYYGAVCPPLDLAPDIKVNGIDYIETIDQGDNLSVTLSLDAGDYEGDNADWWLYLFYYMTPADVFIPVPLAHYQAPLYSFPSTEILNTTGLPKGFYVFFYGVDTNPNGIFDADQLHFDIVGVEIE